MTKPRLHLDADASRISLLRALLGRGHDVTRTPNQWMELDTSDEQQLLGVTGQGGAIFTYNIRDFMALAQHYPKHAGIILSTQKPLPILIKGLDRCLSETSLEYWPGKVRWLNDWINK